MAKPPGTYRPARTEHRSQSHHRAHEEQAERSGPRPRCDHPLVAQGDAEVITGQSQLLELVGHLREVGSFAYDSEFIGENSYVPKLCLLQVASSQRVALIDPLAGLNLDSFWQIVADGTIEKVVHAGQQDLEPAFRNLGKAPAKIFDTQIGAGFAALGYPVALSRVVHEMLGVRLGKGLTFTYWDQRPLSAVQLRYAADDVRYLPALRSDLGVRLESLGHAAWAAEESASLCDPKLYGFDPDHQIQRIRGASGLSQGGMAVLRGLIIWRNEAAREHDLPARSFLRDEILLALARSPIRSVQQLSRVRGLPRPVEADHGERIAQITAAALAEGPSGGPAPRPAPDESPSDQFRCDAILAAAQCLLIGQGIDPELAFNRHDLTALYRHLSKGEPNSEIRLLTGWRQEAVGRTLIELYHHRAELALTWTPAGLKTSTRRLL